MKYHPEIDGLRSVAVLLVVIYHYFPTLIPNGFLGVDIFFVISGFVISGSLYNYDPKLTNGQVIKRFYAKRFRRILPALMVCVLLVFLSLVSLTSQPSRDVFATGGASLIGLSNIVLFDQNIDYFALSSQVNAFTHTWSLGVEEQFYLIFPLLGILIGVFGTSNRQPSIAALGTLFSLMILSFGAFAWMHEANSLAAFYLSPFRFWELFIGCIAFLFNQSKFKIKFPTTLNTLFVTILVACTLWKVDFPVVTTLLTCISTAFLLMSIQDGRLAGWKHLLNAKPINYIGRISYSLYLYHWPVLVIMVVVLGDGVGALLIAIGMSFGFAIASYHLIENPFRKSNSETKDGKYIAISLVLSFAVGVLVVGGGREAAKLIPFKLFDFVNVVPHTPLDAIPCHGQIRLVNLSDPLSECLGFEPNSSPNDIFLLGDSHAAQLTFPLRKITNELGTSLFFMNPEWSNQFPYGLMNESNASWGDDLNQTLKNADKGDFVILTFHRGHLNLERDLHIGGSEVIMANEKTTNLTSNLQRLAPIFIDKGVKLILVLDTPLLSYLTQIEACALQIQLWGSTSCTVGMEQDHRTRRRQQNVFDSVAADFPDSVAVVDPSIVLFDDNKRFNPIAADGSYRMIDWSHLSQSEANKLTDFFRDILVDSPPNSLD